MDHCPLIELRNDLRVGLNDVPTDAPEFPAIAAAAETLEAALTQLIDRTHGTISVDLSQLDEGHLSRAVAALGGAA